MRGDRIVLRESNRVARANRAPSKRVCKTIISDWQIELMNSLKNVTINNEAVEEIEELENINLDNFNLDVELNDNVIDDYWIGFFNDHVYI